MHAHGIDNRYSIADRGASHTISVLQPSLNAIETTTRHSTRCNDRILSTLKRWMWCKSYSTSMSDCHLHHQLRQDVMCLERLIASNPHTASRKTRPEIAGLTVHYWITDCRIQRTRDCSWWHLNSTYRLVTFFTVLKSPFSVHLRWSVLAGNWDGLQLYATTTYVRSLAFIFHKKKESFIVQSYITWQRKEHNITCRASLSKRDNLVRTNALKTSVILIEAVSRHRHRHHPCHSHLLDRN